MKENSKAARQKNTNEKNAHHLFLGLLLLLFASAFTIYITINIFGLSKTSMEPELTLSPSASPSSPPSPSPTGHGRRWGRRPPPPPPAFMLTPGGLINTPQPEKKIVDKTEAAFRNKKSIVSENDRLPDELKNAPPESRKAYLKDVTLIITSDSEADVYLDDTRGKRYYGSTGEAKDTANTGKYAIHVKVKPGNYLVELKGKNGRIKKSEITVIPLIDEMKQNINLK